MAFFTGIQWTDATVNFWTGCKKVSPGCKFCYMYRDQEKYGKDPTQIKRTSDATFFQSLSWESQKRIFTNSYSDFFIEEADAWREDAWNVIRQTPQHQWQVLTKRPNLIQERLPKDWGEGWENVLLGVSVESQDYWKRVETLVTIPAKYRLLSIEPLLSEVSVLQETGGKRAIDSIDWVIIGGESGNQTGKWLYRPCEIEWIERIVSDLRREAPHVKIFVKQLGTFQSIVYGLKDKHGGDMAEWPDSLDHLKIREFIPFSNH